MLWDFQPKPQLSPTHTAKHPHRAALQHTAFADVLKHLAHLRILPQQLVHFLHRSAGASSNALAAAAGDDLMVIALLLRHRIDDGLDAHKLVLVDLVGHLLHPGQRTDRRKHLHNALQRAELAYLAKLVAEIFKREAIA